MASLVLTVIGDDRPGLVDALSGVISAHGGNWEESRMAHLANKFAGVVMVSVADGRVAALSEALHSLEVEGLLHITAERSTAAVEEAGRRTLTLELVGQDHPGIVHDIASALAARGIGIEEFNSETRSASMAGGELFYANAKLSLPQGVASGELREILENLADELMVDISLDKNHEPAGR